MTYSQAIEYLYQLRQFGTKLGLENTFRLAELAGRPQDRLRFIHVAGTNGKGSTCAMLENIYRLAGLKVGLFTSPHLVSFTERIQINRENISEAKVVELVGRIQSLLKAGSADGAFIPTFFEFVTIMGLIHFAEEKCDLVIWETGMGGRLDATNIVTPLASVITNVQYDHQQWLGETLAKIAFEKAGIIKPGLPVITGRMEKEALDVIERIAGERRAPLFHAESGIEQELSLRGTHQRHNAAVALKTVELLRPQLPVSEELISKGLATTVWAGRMQSYLAPNGSEFILDGAHNLDGLAALAAELQVRGGKFNFIVGMLADKEWRPMLAQLAPLARRIITTRVGSVRSADPVELSATAHELNPRAEILATTSLKEAIAAAGSEKLTIITGSLHFIGEAMELLGASAAASVPERGLNEWDASGPRTIAPGGEKHKIET